VPGPDALLLVSFGGPDGPDDVLPFLENVLRGRPIPRKRLLEVAAHYQRFGGVSPINQQNRALLAALRDSVDVPVYWGNRNWHPLLTETIAQMRDDGVERAVAFVTSAYASYSGCRQYLDDIDAARGAVGAGAPVITKIRPYFDLPAFIEVWAEALQAARATAGLAAPVLFSAHSIPAAQAATCDYQRQLQHTARQIVERLETPAPDWSLVYQSRSGPPSQPWLGPDVVDAIRALPAGTGSVVVAPIGFVSDHMEVAYDLDIQAAEVAQAVGVRLVRAATPGTHRRFVAMISELGTQYLAGDAPSCAEGCCPRPAIRPILADSHG
jgi:ferrochelatase